MNRLIFTCLVVHSLAGCASLPPPVHLDFLNRTPSRDQVVSRLGPASSSFEADAVLTYRLSQNKAEYYVVPKKQYRGWEGVNYDLVLAFDANGSLEQHKLVPIRPSGHAH